MQKSIKRHIQDFIAKRSNCIEIADYNYNNYKKTPTSLRKMVRKEDVLKYCKENNHDLEIKSFSDFVGSSFTKVRWTTFLGLFAFNKQCWLDSLAGRHGYAYTTKQLSERKAYKVKPKSVKQINAFRKAWFSEDKGREFKGLSKRLQSKLYNNVPSVDGCYR
jgi:hypothetical protein